MRSAYRRVASGSTVGSGSFRQSAYDGAIIARFKRLVETEVEGRERTSLEAFERQHQAALGQKFETRITRFGKARRLS